MTFIVDVGEHERSVEVRRDGEAWYVTVDGKPVAVDARRIGARWSLLIGLASYDVAIEEAAAGALLLSVNGIRVPVSVARPRSGRARQDRQAVSAAGPLTISAPMPGRIVKVLVKPGEGVTSRQGLIVVEAMKMENELRAPRAGTVREVRVAEGALVEAGTALLVLE